MMSVFPVLHIENPFVVSISAPIALPTSSAADAARAVLILNESAQYNRLVSSFLLGRLLLEYWSSFRVQIPIVDV